MKATVQLFGDIVPNGTTGGTSGDSFAARLARLPPFDELVVEVDSCGGDPSSAVQIFKALLKYPAVTAKVVGLAGSAALDICMAADAVVWVAGAVGHTHLGCCYGC